jgi:hypothetical protein
MASWLTGRAQKGDRIATWAAKGELTCLMPLAAARAGMVHVPINPLLKRAQVAHILADSGAVLLIATPARLATLEPGDAPCPVLGEGEAVEESRAFPPWRRRRPIPMNWPRSFIPAVRPGGPRGDAVPRQYVAGGAKRGDLSGPAAR